TRRFEPSWRGGSTSPRPSCPARTERPRPTGCGPTGTGPTPCSSLGSPAGRARIRRTPMVARVAASILSADFAYLGDQIKLVEPHADLIHIDAMDAHFVPPLSVGPVVVESVRRVTA